MVRFPPNEAVLHVNLLEAHNRRLATRPDLERLYHEQTHRYDTSTFDFMDAFQGMYECETLHKIHEPGGMLDDPVCPALRRARVLAGMCDTVQGHGRGAKNKMNKRWRSHPPRITFLDLYRTFIRDFILPIVDDGSGRVVYQAEPALRCVMPGKHAPTPLHQDVEYLHSPSEINFWVPITNVKGNNTLWSESEPGKEDYHSFDVSYGEVVQFWGNQCRHFTVPNDTSDTRVSFDFRVTPWHMYEEYSTEMQLKCKESKQFRVGSYWQVMEKHEATQPSMFQQEACSLGDPSRARPSEPMTDHPDP